MKIIRNAQTALNDLESIIELTTIDFNYYEELQMLGVNEKNARIRATIRGLLKQELNIDNNPNKDTYETFEIFSDLMFDEICLIQDNQHSASFKTHDFYTRLLQNTTFTDELYEKFGCYFVLETNDINNISDVQIKYEFERRFGKSEEIDLDLDDEDDLDLDLGDDDELDLDSDDDLDLGSEDDLDLYSDDDLDLDTDDLDLDGDDELDLDSDDDLDLDLESDAEIKARELEEARIAQKRLELEKAKEAKQKKLQATSDLVDDRPFCDVALLDYDYCISCLKVVEEHHKNGQMVNIPMCFFPLYDFELDTTTDYKEATLEKVLERLHNDRMFDRELIDGEWHYALTEQGESELIDNRATLKSEVQTNQGQGTITLKKYKGKKTFSQFSFEKGDVCVRWYGENFYFSSYEEIHRVIGVLDNAIPNKWFDAVVDEYCIYDTISLSNALKSFYVESLHIEQKFIDFINVKLNGKTDVKIPLAAFANELTFGSIDKTNKVLRRLLSKKLIKREMITSGGAYSYWLGKGDKLDFNIDF